MPDALAPALKTSRTRQRGLDPVRARYSVELDFMVWARNE
jgi:hypothetical protein